MLPRVSYVQAEEADFLLFSTADQISETLFRSGTWAADLLTVANVFLYNIDQPVILDVGANLGSFAIPLAKKVQAVKGKVIAFEPQRIVFYQLCGNIIVDPDFETAV